MLMAVLAYANDVLLQLALLAQFDLELRQQGVPDLGLGQQGLASIAVSHDCSSLSKCTWICCRM